MGILWILIPLALLLGLGFLVLFVWSAKSGQYDDLETPAHQILFSERTSRHESNNP